MDSLSLIYWWWSIPANLMNMSYWCMNSHILMVLKWMSKLKIDVKIEDFPHCHTYHCEGAIIIESIDAWRSLTTPTGSHVSYSNESGTTFHCGRWSPYCPICLQSLLKQWESDVFKGYLSIHLSSIVKKQCKKSPYGIYYLKKCIVLHSSLYIKTLKEKRKVVFIGMRGLW